MITGLPNYSSIIPTTQVKGLAIAIGATAVVAGAGAIGSLFAFGPLGPAVALGVLVRHLSVSVYRGLTELLPDRRCFGRNRRAIGLDRIPG